MSNNPFIREKSGLVKELSWFDIMIMSIAAPAASGILYYSVNMQTKYPGGSVGVAFIIGMIVFLPIVFLISLLASGMPRAGSLYVAVSRVVSPTMGYIGAMLYVFGQALVAGILGNIIMNILGSILIIAGKAYEFYDLIYVGELFSSKAGNIVGGIIWVLLFWFVTLKGMKTFKKVMRIFFYIPLFTSLIVILYFFFASKQNAIEIFNSTWGTGSFQNIITLASGFGWKHTSFSFGSTVGLFLIVIWAYNGIEMSCYAGSEIQNPNKNLLKGFLLGWLGVSLIYILLAFAVFIPFGDFISAFDFVTSQDQAKVLLPDNLINVKPSIPFYIISISRIPLLGLCLALMIVLWFVNSIPPIFLSTSRIIFALSMDRALPHSFSKYNESNGAPTWATHIVALIAIFGVIFQTYNISLVIGATMFCTFFIFWLYGLTGILLPYKKPEIYRQLPVKGSVFGIPLITLCGFFTFFFGWFFIFITLKEVVHSYVIMAILSGILTILVILYWYQQKVNFKNGISTDNIYSQLPPE
ncbi:MAG: APC family permease [Bacteroidia bacterium]|nr:APC family permease [Bacteroidia bacterium]